MAAKKKPAVRGEGVSRSRGPRKTKEMCRGCRDDFYNGTNGLGVKECWCFKGAEVITAYRIGWWVPMASAKNFKKVRALKCWHAPGQVAQFASLPVHLRHEEGR